MSTITCDSARSVECRLKAPLLLAGFFALVGCTDLQRPEAGTEATVAPATSKLALDPPCQQEFQSGRWTSFATAPRYEHAAALYGEGAAVVCGGNSAPAVYDASCELLSLGDDGDTSRTQLDCGAFPALPEFRIRASLTTLTTDSVLSAGGFNAGVTFGSARTGKTSGWGAAQLMQPREAHTASLVGGALVLFGGRAGLDSVGSVEVLGRSLSATRLEYLRSGHTATLVSGDRLVVVGGGQNNGQLKSVGIFSPPDGWVALPDLPEPRMDHTATLLEDDRILVVGGWAEIDSQTYGYIAKPLVLDVSAPASGDPDWSKREWVTVDDSGVVARAYHSAARLGNYVVVAGGQTEDGATSIVEAYDWKRDTWSRLDPMNVERKGFPLIALDERHLLASAGYGRNSAVASSEVFAPLLVGDSCTRSLDCISGHCVDGVCCESACEGQCYSCAEGDSRGVCVAVDGVPHQPRDACPRHLLCEIRGETAACATSCQADSGCARGYFCNGSVCEEQRVQGAECDRDGFCAGGLPCVDGVCCESACPGQCESCNQEQIRGECQPVPAGEPPSDFKPACDASGDAKCGASCDGAETDRCVYVPAGSSCGAASCSESRLSEEPLCDGRGACVSGEASDCAPNGCVDGRCISACTSDGECAEGAHCASGRCVRCVEVTCNLEGYRCDLVADACRTQCQYSETDCAGGYYCHPRYRTCEKVALLPNGELPSCAATPTKKASSFGATSALLASFLLWARRRRGHAQSSR